MPGFAIRYPYLIVVICLIIAVVGVSSVLRMPVDMFPAMNIPVVVVATFYSGMPPEQIETDITSRFERFFTLGSGIEHIESRSLPGVSVIKIFFQPGTDADSAVTTISNLAMAQLRRLPPGTLPPVVLKFDASSLPVCLVTFKGRGLSETQLRDLAQFNVRNQLAGVPGASVPPPFGGKYRQIMVYVDPLKLAFHGLSAMDVVRAVNDSNLILPAGDIRLGPYDYNIYTNSQLTDVEAINALPLKTVGAASITVADIGEAKDANQIQTNIVRVDGQRSVYAPVLKQGGDVNTIAVVDGVRQTVGRLVDVPRELVTRVVFDQSQFVKLAIHTLIDEGALGLFLTSVLILIFLGSMRATVAVFFSIPLSALATFIALWLGGGSVNSMVLGGLALAFSRLIDNSVVVLENIHRHLEAGESPRVAAENGGAEVALPVLAATLTTAVVFFPVTFLYGISKFLFSALAEAVVLSLFASYAVALTVVPLFCVRFLKARSGASRAGGYQARFDRRFGAVLNGYERLIRRLLRHPGAALAAMAAIFLASLAIYPRLGISFFPRTDAGQFVITLKSPSGTRLEVTEEHVKQIESMIREIVRPEDLGMIVSNIGTVAGFSAIYTSNSAQHTAVVQVSLNADHRIGSYEYIRRVRRRIAAEMPHVSAFFQSGGLVDAVLNLGLAAPIDVQVSGADLKADYAVAASLARRIRNIPGAGDVFIPQDIDYPALKLDVDRVRAGQLGLQQKEVVQNVITALNSNTMIAPSYWIDPKTGYDYMLTVQYPETGVRSIEDLKAIPVRSLARLPSSEKDWAFHPGYGASSNPPRLDALSSISRIQSPTEVDHYQIRRTIDVFVQPGGEDLGAIARAVQDTAASAPVPEGIQIDLRGMVQGMFSSFWSFGAGLGLSLVLLYLILVAQFRSFLDPCLILLAVPAGLTGVLLTLYFTGTTLNVMSLMGVIMLVGIVVSNSILIVEFAHRLRRAGTPVLEAIAQASRIRLRPVLITSLATIIGLLPMALKLGTGSDAYAPLALSVVGGLAASVLLTVFIVPAAYVLAYRER